MSGVAGFPPEPTGQRDPFGGPFFIAQIWVIFSWYNGLMDNEHTMDVVYVVREDPENEALRYSLRSLRHFKRLRNVVLAGYRPSWVNPDSTVWVQRNQAGYTDLENSNINLRSTLTHLDELSDNFVLMNDDFYFMRDTDIIPVWHQGSLDKRIEGYKSTVMAQAYSLIRTRRELEKLSVPEPYQSYELHTPFVYNKEQLLHLLEVSDLRDIARRPRTLYGNFYKIKGVEHADVKGPKPLSKDFWSTDSAALRPDGRGTSSRGSGSGKSEGSRRKPAAILRDAHPHASPYERT